MKLTKLDRVEVEEINRFAPKTRHRKCVVSSATGSTRKLSKSKLKTRYKEPPRTGQNPYVKIIKH